MSEQVYIASGSRSPIGSFQGQFSRMSVYDIMNPVLQAAVDRSNIDATEINEIYIGNVLSAGKGQNPARQVAFSAQLPIEVPAITVNMLCGSGLKAITLGYNSIRAGSASVVCCGGMENMSQAEHSANIRTPIRLGDAILKDTLVHDGLTDAMSNVHMGATAEQVISVYQISREEQDRYAYDSQKKCALAVTNNDFLAEIVGIRVPSRGDNFIISDEFPKPNTTLEGLSQLVAIHNKRDGSVTAGNSAGNNDGAAAVILCHSAVKDRLSLQPLARILGFAETGTDPMMMGTAPVKAIKILLEKVHWLAKDVDLFEINEPFAATAIVVIRELGVDPTKVNVSGGEIALGSPMGASGTRILVTLMYALRRMGLRRGIAACAVGGGMAIAVAIEMC